MKAAGLDIDDAGRPRAADHAHQFASGDRAVPLSGESQQRVSRVPRRPAPQAGAAAISAVGPGIPPFLGTAARRYLVRLAAGKGDSAVLAWVGDIGAYTLSKELTNGANSDTSYLTPNPPLINDVFDRKSAKQLSTFGHPNSLVVSINYTTPKVAGVPRR